MATYETPGVYIEEISTLPPSVAGVSTAIPAFIGYTETGNGVARIRTLLEYETIFGRAQPSKFEVTAKNHEVVSIKRTAAENDIEYLMYYAMSLFFKNGGESCYIVSIGNYPQTAAKQDFIDGLAALEKEDEPTLIVLTDAVNLDSDDYYGVCQQALIQCNKLGDRFAILDVKQQEEGCEIFRDEKTDPKKTGIGMNNLKYGAAYYPYLQTLLTYQYQEADVTVGTDTEGAPKMQWQKEFGTNGIKVSYTGEEDEPQVQITKGSQGDSLTFEISGNTLKIKKVTSNDGNAVAAAWEKWQAEFKPSGFSVSKNGTGESEIDSTYPASELLEKKELESDDSAMKTLELRKDTETALYNQIKTELAKQRVVLPPSAAIAGIYASVDRERGVWKAPANVSLSAVLGPVTKITNAEQESLNVDPNAGKSINAIRAFTGKGTLVWGARTLAGNDNEWRYINVRRLFNYIEESTRKATDFAVFEPNDASTWLKVKAMIESFLYGLWEQGALAGPTPEAAYFVNVGLGKTMTNQDILEGRMNVEIGIAAVRPAEFIVLKFSHKMQEA